MMAARVNAVVLALIFGWGIVFASEVASTDEYVLLMPNVQPTEPETYLCTTVKLDEDKTYYILGFMPNATSNIAHHMLLYGCQEPGRLEEVWDCGEMHHSKSNFNRGSVCGSGSQVIYAWAKDAPKLELPEGIGFKVGKDSPIQYLVLQVHYADVSPFQQGGTDDSGVILSYTETPMPRTAGVIMLSTNGFLRPRSKEHMEAACRINENMELHPLAFRTHTHALGKVVSGYVIQRKGYWQNKWRLLGKKNPQLPQMFYPVADPNIVIKKGDILAARCTMNNYRTRITKVGPTSADEMCNFYLLYWVEGDRTLNQKYCTSWGPPIWYWKQFPLTNIPEEEASQL